MDTKSELNVLVSNIIEENNYSHCRLCLKHITDGQFTRFEDVVLITTDDNYLTLKEILRKVLGEDACEDIPGINAVCNNCATKATEVLSFMWLYEASSEKLNKVLNSMNLALNVDINIDNKEKVLIDCSEDESQLYIMQDNSKKVPHKNQLKCLKCKESFRETNDFIQHNEKEHGLYTCGKCLYANKNMESLKEHEESDQIFVCKDCSQGMCTEESLLEHFNVTHIIHVCKKCGRSVKGLDKLLAHEEKHNLHVCPKCGKNYLSKDCYLKHLELCFEDEMHPMKNEIKKTHNNLNVCPKCSKRYLTRECYLKHVELCLEDRIELHPRRSEIKKTHFCADCGKGYSTPGGLRVHERFVHKNILGHACDQCGKKFSAPCYLKAHMVTHTKERNFPCDTCGRKFVTKESLLYHVRRHTGEKPYSCDICNEKFVNASARAEHKKFKHKDPTIRCEYCPRMFYTKNFLRIHLRKHQDPRNKLYIGRADVPANVPAEQNMRIRLLDYDS